MRGDAAFLAPRAAPTTGLPPLLLRRIPILSWLPKYTFQEFRADMIAGLTVGVVVVPQGIAYAMLAELPPVYGLYAALVPLPVYAMLGSSRHISIGPFALVSILVSETVNAVLDPSFKHEGAMEAPALQIDRREERYIEAVMLLSLMIGIVHLAMALLNLDVVVTAFLSEPVLSGFTTASALLICTSQLKHLLGMVIPRGTFLHTLLYAAEHWREVQLLALAFGLGGVLLLELSKVANKRYCPSVNLPEQLLLLVVAALLAATLPEEMVGGIGSPLRLVGVVPAGLPTPKAPPLFDLELLIDLIQPALWCGLFAYILAVSIVKSMALKFEYSIDSNQELLAFGVANTIGSFFLAYPAAGSLSRSALIASICGRECTPMHGCWTFLLVLIVLVCLTPAFRTLPYAVLASIVFMSVRSLLDFGSCRRLFRLNPADGVLWFVAFLATLGFGVQLGIAISVACSLFTLILSSMRPPYAMLGRLPGTHVFVDLRRHPEARRVPGVVLFGYSAALHFANKDHFRESLHKLIARRDVDGSSGAFAPSASASAPSPGGGHGHQGGAEDLTSQQILFEEPADIRTSADLAPATPLLETPNTPAAKLAASRVAAIVAAEKQEVPPTPPPPPPASRSPSATHAGAPVDSADQVHKVDKEEAGAVRVVVLDFIGISGIDATALRMLQDLRKEFNERGIRLLLCNVQGQPKDLLARAGFFDKIGMESVFGRLDLAAKAASEIASGAAEGGANFHFGAARRPSALEKAFTLSNLWRASPGWSPAAAAPEKEKELV